jgi:hypothetical protein
MNMIHMTGVSRREMKKLTRETTWQKASWRTFLNMSNGRLRKSRSVEWTTR